MVARWIALVVLAIAAPLALAQQPPQAAGTTIDVGKTGWANKRPVVAAACPFGCRSCRMR
jgi:hypothetical protein